MSKYATLLYLCFAIWACNVSAEELSVALHVSAMPAKTELPVRFAAEGLVLGASPDEIVTAIHAMDPEMRIERTTDRVVLDVDSRKVVAEPFLSHIMATNIRYRSGQRVWTLIEVSFALPTTGGGAVGISVEHRADDFMMTAVALHDQLLTDYGKPSAEELFALDSLVERLRGSLVMQWRFGRNSLLPCPTACFADSSPIDIKRLNEYQQIAAQGTFALVSMLANSNAKHTGIRGTDLSLEDAATKALSLDEGLRQLTEAAHANPAILVKPN